MIDTAPPRRFIAAQESRRRERRRLIPRRSEELTLHYAEQALLGAVSAWAEAVEAGGPRPELALLVAHDRYQRALTELHPGAS